MTTTNSNNQKVQKYGFSAFLWRHKGATFFFLLFIVSIVWSFVKINGLNSAIKQLKIDQKIEIEKIKIDEYTNVSRIFSWEIRTEMLKNNIEQADVYLNKMIEDDKILKIQILDISNSQIMLSTDKNEINSKIANFITLNSVENNSRINDSIVRFFTPITDMNKQIALSVMDVRIVK